MSRAAGVWRSAGCRGETEPAPPDALIQEYTMASPQEPETAPAPPQLFAEFIRERKSEILREWERAVRGVPKAADLERPALLDHVPDLLDRIAEIADEIVAGGQPRLPFQLVESHALERLG